METSEHGEWSGNSPPQKCEEQGWGGTEFTVHSSYTSTLFLELELNSIPIFQKFYYKELN